MDGKYSIRVGFDLKTLAKSFSLRLDEFSLLTRIFIQNFILIFLITR